VLRTWGAVAVDVAVAELDPVDDSELVADFEDEPLVDEDLVVVVEADVDFVALEVFVALGDKVERGVSVDVGDLAAEEMTSTALGPGHTKTIPLPPHPPCPQWPGAHTLLTT
jgi:hypothetical protein